MVRQPRNYSPLSHSGTALEAFSKNNIMSEDKNQKEAPKVFAEKPGSLGSNVNHAPSIPVDENKVEDEAEEKIEEDEQAAKVKAIKKEDSTGEAG